MKRLLLNVTTSNLALQGCGDGFIQNGSDEPSSIEWSCNGKLNSSGVSLARDSEGEVGSNNPFLEEVIESPSQNSCGDVEGLSGAFSSTQDIYLRCAYDQGQTIEYKITLMGNDQGTISAYSEMDNNYTINAFLIPNVFFDDFIWIEEVFSVYIEDNRIIIKRVFQICGTQCTRIYIIDRKTGALTYHYDNEVRDGKIIGRCHASENMVAIQCPAIERVSSALKTVNTMALAENFDIHPSAYQKIPKTIRSNFKTRKIEAHGLSVFHI